MSIAESFLQEKLQTEVKIEKSKVDILNGVVLENVYIPDQKKDTLFFASRLAVRMEYLPLFKGKLVFSNMQLFGFQLYAKKDNPKANLNLQFIIDALKNDDPDKKPSKINLRFNSILMRRGHLSYDVLSEPETVGKFNPNHVDLTKFTGTISIKKISNDSLNVDLRKLSFEEKSGLLLNKLSFKAHANKENAIITHFHIALPETQLELDNLYATYQLDNDNFNFVNDAKWDLKIKSSTITLKDIAPFVPAFRNFSDKVFLSATANGTLNDFVIENFAVNSGASLMVTGSMEMRDALQREEAFVMGRINNLFIQSQRIANLANNFTADNIQVPKFITNLGAIHFKGDISGYLDDLVAYGNFSTALGNFSTDLMMGYRENLRTFRGAIKTESFKLGALINQEKTIGSIGLKVNLDAKVIAGNPPSGFVKGIITEIDIKDYAYKNIELDGNFSTTSFDGKVSIDDPNGKISVQGKMNWGKSIPDVNVNIDVDHLHLGALNLSNKYTNSTLSFSALANFQGKHIDDSHGHLQVDNFNFTNNGEALFLEKVAVDINGPASFRTFSIHSDIINGEASGAIYFKTIASDFQDIASQYLPVFMRQNGFKNHPENILSGEFTINNTADLTRVLNLPVTIVDTTTISAKLDGESDQLKLEIHSPKLKIQKNNLEGTSLFLENSAQEVNLEFSSRRIDANKKNNFDMKLFAKAQNDSVFTNIQLANNDSIERTFGDIKFLSAFTKDFENSLRTIIDVSPSSFTLKNTPFEIQNSQLDIYAGKIRIDDFVLDGVDEHIKIDGIYSKATTDTVYMDLHNANLSIIELITNNTILDFGGLATGKVTIVGKETGMPILFTNLNVSNFSYNKALLGHLELRGEWHEHNQGIFMDGKIVQEGYDPTNVLGYIFPTKDSLDLRVNANHINLKLVNPFVANILNDFSGWGYGDVRMFGKFKTISFVGKPYLQNVNFGIEFLNTTYSFSDTLYMTKDEFRLNRIQLSDKSKNTARVNASIKHKHFKDFSYRADINTRNLHVFNATQKQNPLFFGSVYGRGSASLHGDLDRIFINVDMASTRNSYLTLSLFDNITAANLDFVTFIPKKEKENVIKNQPPEIKSAFEIDLDLKINATPEANIALIMDPHTGDILKGNGSGNMRVEYNSRTEDLSLEGKYIIDEGDYNFNWEELVKKDFKINAGSSVTFRGDPYTADLNIRAIYGLSTDISALENTLGEESGRQNVPVDVIVDITGKLDKPDIKLDIDLPQSGEDIKRKVNSLIYTENDKTKQVFYLLLFGQFDSPDHIAVTNSGSGQWAAVVSSTLSSQLNTFLSQISDKVSIGTSIQSKNRGGIQDLEVGLNISTQIFDNRVILKSNLGYRDNMYQSNNFIGDFDVEYKLTPRGNIRLKGYSHYNDNSLYYGRSGLTTQGVGIMYTTDFSRFSELFQRGRERRRESDVSENDFETPDWISWEDRSPKLTENE